MPSQLCARAVRAIRLPGLWTAALASLLVTAVPAQAVRSGDKGNKTVRGHG
jgi:hypothetical protein